jgi:predicted RNase H-like HicB family nuclease
MKVNSEESAVKININELIKQPYNIIIQQDLDGCYYAKVEELDGCFAEGQTAQEAWENIQDSMKNWMEIAQEMNVPIPLPKSNQETEYSGKYLLRMPKKLHKELTMTAEEEGISLNLLMVNLLSSRLSFQRIEQKITDLCATSNSIKQGMGWIVNQHANQGNVVTTSTYNFGRSKKPIVFHDSGYSKDMWGK